MNKLNKKSEVYAVQYNEKVLVIHYDCNRRKYWDRKNVCVIGDGDLHNILVDKVYSIYIGDIETIIIDPLLINYKFTSCSSLFSGFVKLKRIIGLEYLNTSEAVNMRCMFRACKSLVSLNLRGFDTSKVRDMSSMFWGCESLTNIDVSNFNTSNVTNISAMFYECKSLTNIDLSNFNTSSVEYMDNMFSCCESLAEVNISSFNTSDETGMRWMFAECKNLKTIHTGDGWNISKKFSEGIFC